MKGKAEGLLIKRFTNFFAGTSQKWYHEKKRCINKLISLT